jgi:hypothetical protein
MIRIEIQLYNKIESSHNAEGFQFLGNLDEFWIYLSSGQKQIYRISDIHYFCVYDHKEIKQWNH